MANYHAGRRKEYATQRALEAAGYYTVRAASSKGSFDIIGYRKGSIRFISVKSGSARPTGVEREALERLSRELAPHTVELWRWPRGAREAIVEVI